MNKYRKNLLIVLLILALPVLAGCTKAVPADAQEQTMQAVITQIWEDLVVVKPPEEQNEAEGYVVGKEYLPEDYSPTVGDTLEITYRGGIMETDPGQFMEIRTVTLVEEAPEILEAAEGDLPDYEYKGNVPLLKAICSYMTRDKTQGDYPEGNPWIPAPVILKVDDSDPSDIRVWGNFWGLRYTRDGKTLIELGGGEAPGLMHLSQTSPSEYEVTEFETVGDGTLYYEDLKKLCEGVEEDEQESLLDLFMASNGANEDPARYTIKTFLEQYVEWNGLEIENYQEQGWDPVKLEPVKKVMMNGKIYEDTGEFLYSARCGNMDFSFDTVTENGADPTEDGQSNFGKCSGQRTDRDEWILIEIDGADHLFACPAE